MDDNNQYSNGMNLESASVSNVPNPKRGHMKIYYFILTIIVLALVGGGIYQWQHSKVVALNKVIALNSKINNHTNFPELATITKKIPQLGIEFNLPLVLNDLTYSYSQNSTGFDNETMNLAYFSTKSLQSLVPDCTASSGDALGAIATIKGTYAVKNAQEAMSVGPLLKQFPTFYVTYSTHSPQANCISGQQANVEAISDLQNMQEYILENSIVNSVRPIAK